MVLFTGIFQVPEQQLHCGKVHTAMAGSSVLES